MVLLKTAPWILFASLALVGVSQAQTYSCSVQFLEQFVNANNQYRAKHSAPYLTIDPQLTGYAQGWANQLLAQGPVDLKVTPNPNNQIYGENLYGYWSSAGTLPAGNAPVDNWYGGSKYYQPYYGGEPNMADFQKFGAFSQLVWVASKQVGVGCAGNGKVFYVVANYNPGGNYDGQFAANVLAPVYLTRSANFSADILTGGPEAVPENRPAEKPADKPADKPAEVPIVTLPLVPQAPAAIVQVPQPALPGPEVSNKLPVVEPEVSNKLPVVGPEVSKLPAVPAVGPDVSKLPAPPADGGVAPYAAAPAA